MGAVDVLNYNDEVGGILGISSANRFSCFQKKEFNNNTLTKSIKFVYDGFKLIAEFDVLNSNNVLRSYAWSNTDLNTPMWLKSDSNYYYYMLDGNKNVTKLIDEMGATANHYEYSPFGTLINEVESVENPFKFSSEYYDSETGLIYYNFRYYNPETGKWLKRDPIAEQGGFNLYGFVSNNSIYYWDYLGLDPIDNTPKTKEFQKQQDKYVKDRLSVANKLLIPTFSCNLPQYDENFGPDKKQRKFNKYDNTIKLSVLYWANRFGFNLKLSKECLCKIAKVMKAIAWKETRMGYGAGWNNVKKIKIRDKNGKEKYIKVKKNKRYPLGWIDTEDVMQVANGEDLSVIKKVIEASRSFNNAHRIVKLTDDIRKDYSYKNIDGDQSIFYGVMWFFYKLQKKGICDCSNKDLKRAISGYNGGGSKGYSSKVWKGYTTGKQY